MHGDGEELLPASTRTLLPPATLAWRVLAAAAAATLIVLAVPAQASAAELRYGDRGSAVVSLQQHLVALGYLQRGAVDGTFGDETWYAVVAFQGWEQIKRDGVVGRETRRALRDARPPQPWQRLPRALEIDLTRQVLLIVEGGAVRRIVHASTGARSRTPEGRFSVGRRLRKSWSPRYHVWLRYALYFHGGFAIHAFPFVPDQPASHGCVRIPVEDARLVFDAAPLRTPVLIRGRTSRS